MDKIRILVVDDHQIVRDGIISILDGESDIEIVGAMENAIHALKAIATSNPDVIIADLSMPEMSGLEFTAKIMEQYPSIKVLILSMFNDEEYILNAIKTGASGYLPKQDSTTELLLNAIRSVANGDEFFSPSISKIVIKSYINNLKTNRKSEQEQEVVLTFREKEILKLYAEGFSNSEIADKLCLSVNTVKTHKNNIMQKHNFKSTVELIKYAIKNGIVEL